MNLLDLAIAAKMGGGKAPFGDQEVILFPQTDIEMIDGAAMDMAGVWLAEGKFCNIESGKTYTVVFNGTPYSVSAIDVGEDNLLLGNLVFYGGDDTGEPFLLTDNVLISTESTVNLMIKAIETKQFDYKLLPPVPEIDLTSLGDFSTLHGLNIPDDMRAELIDALEKAALRGMCVVRANGVRLKSGNTIYLHSGIMCTVRNIGGRNCAIESTFSDVSGNVYYVRFVYNHAEKVVKQNSCQLFKV